MKTFTKSFIAIIVALMIVAMVPVCASAEQCNYNSLKGLEIAGNTSVGTQLYHGRSVINSESHNCLGSTDSRTVQTFDGVGLMSSASGSICVTGMGMYGGNLGAVEGTGTFKSGMSGSISGEVCGIEGNIAFYTHSNVVLSGRNGSF